MKNLFSLLIVVIFISLIIFLTNQGQKIENKQIKYVTLAGVKLEVELALTEEEQRKGLSGRKSLENDQGMLFVFDQPGKYYFWMKDMNFPIDIIWIGEENEIIYIKKDAKPGNTLETFGPNENSRYVLEVNSGFSEKNDLKIGEKIEFSY